MEVRFTRVCPFLCVAEAVVRGFKLGLLTSADYNNLSQCESLDDIKLYLVGPYCDPPLLIFKI